MATEMLSLRSLIPRIFPSFRCKYMSLGFYNVQKLRVSHQSTISKTETTQDDSPVIRLSDSCVKVSA